MAIQVKIEESWHRQLSSQFSEPYFAQLAEFVRAEYAAGPCYPPAAQVFEAFNQTPFHQVKVVILGQDPYHGPGQAHGLCFSVNDGVPFPPSLQNIFKEVEAQTGAPIPTSGNLTRWARQGVFLPNTLLTVRAHQAGSHQGQGWEQFTNAVLARLSQERQHLVFMLWGAHAIRCGRLVDHSRHLVLTSPHPSPLSSYRGFFGNEHFVKCNQYLTEHGQEPIQW